MDASIIICTHNRAESLISTLDALQALVTTMRWEAIVVDNASRDHTKEIVSVAARRFPVALRYIYEAEPGKYAALNTGIQSARGAIIAATDDDALPAVDWLEQLADGLQRHQCDFVGGPVRPIWNGRRPRWLPDNSSVHWKVLALHDYGDQPREYGVGIGWPLGVNVAYRRDVFARVGLFDNRLGRVAGTLRNQSQREWHLRARAAGARGFYVPGALVHHTVVAERLTKNYFRRWYYWHGVSRAILYRHTGFHIEDAERFGKQREARHVFGVPFSLFRKAIRTAGSCFRRSLLGQQTEAFEYELWLWFFAGLVHESWASHTRSSRAGVPDPQMPALPDVRMEQRDAGLRGVEPPPVVREKARETGAKS